MSYKELQNHMQRIADVNYAAATLGWDQETYMPPGAAGLRQVSYLPYRVLRMSYLQETKPKRFCTG